jgi:choline dehydrogenase-like flavoprotein
MVVESYEVPNGHVVETDVCIVGGGMAGIAMARELQRSGFGVVVLESGGIEYEGPSQALYQGTGELSGDDVSARDISNYLVTSRFRQLGGAGNKWGGKCGIPDAEVFEERSWIPNSGWPVSRASLMPFYDLACDVLGIERFGYDEGETQDAKRPALLVGSKDRITTSTRHMSPVTGRNTQDTAFKDYQSGVIDNPSIALYLHANVVDFYLNDAATAVTSVRVATLRKNAFVVQAKQFVLATGGIENARLMLNSNRQQPDGLGNQHGLVGRYFSGHMTLGSGSRVYFTNLTQSLWLYTGGSRKFPLGVLKTAKALQAELGLPNATLTLNGGRPDADPFDESILKSAYLADGRMKSPDRGEFEMKGNHVSVYLMSEEAPNPESRITLSEERDALGMRRVQLDWKFTAGDLDAAMASAELFAREFGATGVGRMKPLFNRDSLLASSGLSSHHIGTTRMHSDPKRGVVDSDCKVHGVDNLYVAGSSVFPSPGIVNPTLTIIALGLKLCSHLRGRL